MQHYFLRPFPEPLRSALVANVVELRARARARRIPVAYTAQPGGMTVDEPDRGIVDELTPAAGEPVLTKWRYSALVRTDLLDRMDGAGRDQLIVCGVFAHVGILVTAIDAFSHDLQPFVVADAIADFSAEYHAWALEYAAQRCGVVRTLPELFR
jgi:isochorismate hydrolase